MLLSGGLFNRDLIPQSLRRPLRNIQIGIFPFRERSKLLSRLGKIFSLTDIITKIYAELRRQTIVLAPQTHVPASIPTEIFHEFTTLRPS